MTLRARWKMGDRFLVRHKDRAIVVIEKRAGVLSVRTESGRGEDVLSLLRAFLGGKGRSALFPVHRLDRDVSGLLVFARTPEARERLVRQFAAHTVERIYLAAVQGLLGRADGMFDSYLRTDDRSLKVYSIDPAKHSTARRAITHWRAIEEFPGRPATLVEIRLETGLRNQIRVHFAEAGHPLLGEKKYGSNADRRPECARERRSQRIFLHATVLGFEHPDTSEWMQFEAPLPPDLARWRHQLRSSARRDPPLHRAPSRKRQRPRKKR